MATIKNYGLFLRGIDKDYESVWDGWVYKKGHVMALLSELRYSVNKGMFPIVTIFLPKDRLNYIKINEPVSNKMPWKFTKTDILKLISEIKKNEKES